jgi:TatD DNase family protein
MKLIDVHAHLDDSRFDDDLEEVVESAKEGGLGVVICSGVNRETNRKVLELSERFDIVKCSFGIYPSDALAEQGISQDDIVRKIKQFSVEEELDWIEKNADRCVAVGEVGLDYQILPDKKEEQKEVFNKIIRVVERIDKPIVIHSRKAEEDCIELLESSSVKKVMMHCFNGKKSLIKRVVENGWYFSVPAVITRLEHFKMLVEMVPLDQLLTETDCPYLSPVAGERNEPKNVVVTIKEIAKIKNLGEEEVADQIWKNAREFFGL